MAGTRDFTRTAGFPAQTAEFTPPEGGCPFTYIHSAKAPAPTTSLWLAYSSGDASSCYPSSFYENSGTFSPGRCPYSWATATSYTLPGGTSGAVCCSSGYTFDGARSLAANDNHDWCTRTVPTNTVGIFQTDLRNINDFVFTGDTPKTALVRALHVRWQESDIAVLGLPPETSAPTGSNGPARETESPGVVPGLGGLSDSAKAGIGAGVGVLAVTILAAVLLLLQRRRRGLRRGEKGELGDGARGLMAGAAATSVNTGGDRGLEASDTLVGAPGRGRQEAVAQDRGPEVQRAEEMQGPWSEYMARWAANQQDWAAYQAGAQQEDLPREDGGLHQDDAHAGALPVDGRTPHDFARLEDSAHTKAGLDDLDDLDALGDMKARVSEDSTLDPPPAGEKN